MCVKIAPSNLLAKSGDVGDFLIVCEIHNTVKQLS